MKKNCLLLCCLFQFTFMIAQVGVGTITPEAALDITSTTNGLLIPRVILTSKNSNLPVINPAGGALVNGTLVYNTATAGVMPNNVIPGYYYWNGANWMAVNGDGGENWSLLGNTGTNSSINFIGTKDDTDVVFKRNNLTAGLLSLSNTSFGVLALQSNTTGSNNTAIGYQSLFSNITGVRNVAIGQNALNLNIASNNIAIGTGTLDANTTGAQNIAFGVDALGANITSSNNTAMGHNALLLSTGAGNVAIGGLAGNANTTGNNNTVIGYNTDVGLGGLSNATAIGANATVNASNALVLGNAANVGIGTTNPVYAKLQVVGFSLFSATAGGFTSGHAAYIRGNDTFSTATTPDYTWWNSEQTGMFHPAANTIAFSANGTGETMRINAAGNIGIRTTTPNGLLELGLDQGRKPGTNTWTIVSDERLKNIEGSYNKGLKELLQLKPIVYHYKNVGNRTFKEQVLNTQQIGFSAQEVQKIFPEAVGTDEDGYLNFNIHTILISYLNAIKEQEVQIVDLQKELAELKNMKTEYNLLKAEVDAIKILLKTTLITR